jgi:hypothetical protein
MPLSRAWTTSSHSDSSGDNCVQARTTGHHTVQVRDSKDPAGPILTFTHDAWTAFTAAIKNGHHHT